MANPCVFETDNYRTHAVPLSLHGDEVPVQGIGRNWSSKILQFSFCLMANAADRIAQQTQLFIWGVFEKFCIPKQDDIMGNNGVFLCNTEMVLQCPFLGDVASKRLAGTTDAWHDVLYTSLLQRVVYIIYKYVFTLCRHLQT